MKKLGITSPIVHLPIMPKGPVILALLAALCYGISIPLAALLLEDISPMLLAALLYIGAGVGMSIVAGTGKREAPITVRDLPFTVAMVALDIAAPILLMTGLSMSTAATASLMGNMEIVATAVIASVFFREAIGSRMWWAISLTFLASILLIIEDFGSISFSRGSILILLASVCWGIENNCTRMLSMKNPLQIVAIKGIGSGFGGLVIALALGAPSVTLSSVVLALILGFLTYGLSVFFYVKAQRDLGASRTSAYYSIAPFVGVILSFFLFEDSITLLFMIALALVSFGVYLAVSERHSHSHVHAEVTHEHRHQHNDGHHIHTHLVNGEHSHMHTHSSIEHEHRHTPDLHHTHDHRIGS